MGPEYTERELEALTDEGLFEKLATAVLREADSVYRTLAHPGVNAEGKTVKSPVDGIGFVRGAQPPHMVIVHHTIAARDGLKNKWLHDPATVKSRGPRPTAPAGDMVKAVDIAAKQRQGQPTLRVTLVLTTNREPDEALLREVHAAAALANIEVDVWTRARLAHFLDIDPQGQWIRYQYLGGEPQRLSKPLLQRLSEKSLAAFTLHEEPSLWVERELDRTLAKRKTPSVLFLVSASGLGKSTSCYKLLKNHIKTGGSGLVISHQVIAASLTLDGAIGATLTGLHPNIEVNAGSIALTLCTPESPLLLIIEDINASGQALVLAEKIVGWDRSSDKREIVPRPIQLICPIWPEMLDALQERPRKAVLERALFSGSFAPHESRAAVQRRANEIGQQISDVTADGIANALGHDPLLIALHDPAKKVTSDTVGDFVERRIARTAAIRGGHPAAKYLLALRGFAAAALKHRILNPLWTELETWPEISESERALLGHLVGIGDVIQLSGTSTNQRMAYRHDRVRDWLLADATRELVASDSLPDEILSEPYFAEVIAAVLGATALGQHLLDRVTRENPLALFHTLRLLDPSSASYQAIIGAIDSWLDSSQSRPEFWRLRLDAVQALAQTEAPDVVRLVKRLGDRNWQGMFARLRNGDITGGIELCHAVEPGATAAWRDVHIDHAKHRFGPALVTKVGEVLRRRGLAEASRIGLLRFAGLISDAALGPAIEACWQCDAERDAHLADYLWAFAECCGHEPERYLKPICDAWAALPSDRSNNRPSPRDELAAHDIRWAFERWAPRQALPYFVKRAEDETLCWPITYMLEPVDDPISVAFVIQKAAEILRRIEGTQSFSHFVSSLPRHWQDRQERYGVGMSASSRAVAESLWRGEGTDRHIRHVAFRLWAATRTDTDLSLLREAGLPSDLSDEILGQRVERGDQAAVPELLAKIRSGEKNARWWWHKVKYVMSDDLLSVLDDELAHRARSVEPKWQNGSDSDYETSDLLMRISPSDAERLLDKYWSSLRHVNNFIQAALHVATPLARELVQTTMAHCDDPDLLLKYIGQHMGLKTKGHPGISRPTQIEALAPYLKHLARHDVVTLWEICNSHGWYTERTRLLDPFLRADGGMLYVDDEPTFAALDDMVVRDHLHWLDHWFDRYAATGAPREVQMGCIARWFEQRKTMRALRLVAQVLVLVGRRADLVMLDTDVADADGGLDIIKANTRYAVYRRTLA